MNRSCGTVVPDGHGPDRQAMGRARADLPATAATGWPRPAVGGHPRRVERLALDPPDRRRFQVWQRSGRLDRLLLRLAEDLRDREQIDLSEAFVDATFASAKKGALASVRHAAAKAPKSWRLSTVLVFQSPSTWPALHRMSRNSSPPPSRPASSPISPP